jgi:hypothetical protein
MAEPEYLEDDIMPTNFQVSFPDFQLVTMFATRPIYRRHTDLLPHTPLN